MSGVRKQIKLKLRQPPPPSAPKKHKPHDDRSPPPSRDDHYEPERSGAPSPIHRGESLKWDYEAKLVGEKVPDPRIHLCEKCELPILVYGRIVPCRHTFCFDCAKNSSDQQWACPRCSERAERVEERKLGTVFMCTFGGTKHSQSGCRRSYNSQHDLDAHINTRHSQGKSSPNVVVPQVPPPPQPPRVSMPVVPSGMLSQPPPTVSLPMTVGPRQILIHSSTGPPVLFAPPTASINVPSSMGGMHRLPLLPHAQMRGVPPTGVQVAATQGLPVTTDVIPAAAGNTAAAVVVQTSLAQAAFQQVFNPSVNQPGQQPQAAASFVSQAQQQNQQQVAQQQANQAAQAATLLAAVAASGAVPPWTGTPPPAAPSSTGQTPPQFGHF